MFFFFNHTATTEIYTLSLHDALPILQTTDVEQARAAVQRFKETGDETFTKKSHAGVDYEVNTRSEEHTSELQSRQYLVCRLLLEKKNKQKRPLVPTGTLNRLAENMP